MNPTQQLFQRVLETMLKEKQNNTSEAALKELVLPPMETPEQQEILKLKEQLEEEKTDHEETKSKLETAESKLSGNNFVIESLNSHIHSMNSQVQHTDEQMKLMSEEHQEVVNDLREKLSQKNDLESTLKQVKEALEGFKVNHLGVVCLRNEVNSLHRKNGGLQKLLRESEEQKKMLEAKIDDDLKNFKKTLEEKDQKINELTEALSEKQAEDKSEEVKEAQINESEKNQIKIKDLTVCAEKDLRIRRIDSCSGNFLWCGPTEYQRATASTRRATLENSILKEALVQAQETAKIAKKELKKQKEDFLKEIDEIWEYAEKVEVDLKENKKIIRKLKAEKKELEEKIIKLKPIAQAQKTDDLPKKEEKLESQDLNLGKASRWAITVKTTIDQAKKDLKTQQEPKNLSLKIPTSIVSEVMKTDDLAKKDLKKHQEQKDQKEEYCLKKTGNDGVPSILQLGKQVKILKAEKAELGKKMAELESKNQKRMVTDHTDPIDSEILPKTEDDSTTHLKTDLHQEDFIKHMDRNLPYLKLAAQNLELIEKKKKDEEDNVGNGAKHCYYHMMIVGNAYQQQEYNQNMFSQKVTGYSLFMKWNREYVIEQIGNDEVKIRNELIRRWYDLSMDAKNKYYDMARKLEKK